MRHHIGISRQGFVKKLLFIIYVIDMTQVKQDFVSLPKKHTF